MADDVVFIGGAVVPLLVTDPVLPDFRETRDVDLVTGVTSRAGYAAVEAQLRALDFDHDTSEGAPLCRWIVDDIRVDVMPPDADMIGFSNAWYPYARDSSGRFPFAPDEAVRLVSAPAFFLTKWEAFQDRGGGTDYYGSHDLEDILMVVNGRAELADEAAATPPPVRRAIGEALGRLSDDPLFWNALPGLVEAGRGETVESRLRQIVAAVG